MKQVATTTIDAPADLVWRTVADVERWSEWTPTITSVRRHDTGDLREGSTADVAQPKQPVRLWTVTSVTPGREFTWVASGTGVRMTAEHTVSTADGRTTVELTFAVAGFLAPLVSLLVGGFIRTAIETEAASLKKWCEQKSR